MKTAVVYYSRNGNARIAANAVNEKTADSELVELTETRARNGVFGFLRSGSEASRGKGSELVGTPWEKVSDYEEFYLVTPIWAGKPTPAMRTFLTKADFSGKTVHIVTVQADAKFSRTELTHAKYKDLITAAGGKTGREIKVHGASAGKTASREHIEDQIRDALA